MPLGSGDYRAGMPQAADHRSDVPAHLEATRGTSRKQPQAATASWLGPAHARRLRTHRVARGVGLTMTALLAFGGTVSYAFYESTWGRGEVSDVSGYVPDMELPSGPDDADAGKPLNILIMGTDLRDAENAAIAGDAKGMGSDTTLLVHISADRSWVEVVSIPRDSLVDIPACTLPDGSMSRPRTDAMFNSAFAIGAAGTQNLDAAAGCTITTVFELTKIPITNHVVAKMTGVIGVVDAIGGVPMCLSEPVVGRKVDLNLPAGEQVLYGRTSIEFLRARKGTGFGLETGTDLKRIERQQAFLNNLTRKIRSGGVLSDPVKTHGMLAAVFESLSMDPTLRDLPRTVGLAHSLRNIDTSRVVFTQLPTDPAPNPNRRVWTKDADAIWQRLLADEPPPGLAPADASTADGGDGTTGDGTTGTATPSATPDGSATPDATPDATPSSPADTSDTTGQNGATDDPPAASPPPEVLPEGVCPS